MRRDNITMKEFGRRINYAANNIISMRRGDRDVTLDMVLKLIEIYNASPDYMTEGKGARFKEKIDLNKLTEVFAREVLKRSAAHKAKNNQHNKEHPANT